MSDVSKIVIVAAAIAASACNKPDPAPVAEPARSASAAVTSSAPASIASATAVLSATAPPSAAPTEAPAAPPAKLHLVVDVPFALTFIGGPGGALLVDAESAWALELRGDTLRPAYGFRDGLSKYLGGQRSGNLESFGGRYPKGVYAIVGVYAPRGTTDHVVHRWQGGGNWQALMSSGNDMSSVTAVEPFGDGLVASVQRLSGEVDIEASAGVRFKPRPAENKSAQCASRIAFVTDLVAPLAGGLVAVGKDCERGHEVIEIFGERGNSQAFVALPDLDETRIAALSTNEVYLAGVPSVPKPPKGAPSAAPSASASAAPNAAFPPGKPVLLALRGGGWVPQPLPDGEKIASLAASPDGSLLAVANGAVWRRPRGGAWSKLALPEGATVSYLVAGSATELWAVDQQKSSLKIYGAKPPRWPIVIGPASGDAPAVAPATPSCESPFVLMYTVNPSTAGTDYDYPLTRAALKGHGELAGMALVLTEHWQLGAFVPTLEMGEKVAALIREKVKGQKPQVVCSKPRVRAHIPVDLATGEISR
jgi:hypothetical protein